MSTRHRRRFPTAGSSGRLSCPRTATRTPHFLSSSTSVSCLASGRWPAARKTFRNPAASTNTRLAVTPCSSRLAPFRMADMRYAWRKRIRLPANWKVVIDAFIEGYHTAGTHPESILHEPGDPRPSRNRLPPPICRPSSPEIMVGVVGEGAPTSVPMIRPTRGDETIPPASYFLLSTRSRNTNFWTLPEAFIGNSFTISIRRGTL